MWTSQVFGHHDKMARTKTHRTSQTRSIQRRNIHKEITIFLCFSDFSVFLFLIFNYLKDFANQQNYCEVRMFRTVHFFPQM